MLTSGPVFRETPTSLFQTDPVSNLQFFANFKKVSLEPERLLMLAVLEDAIKCVEKYANVKSGRNRTLFDETIDWIRSKNDEWLFSFENVCDALGLNAGRVRDALLQMVVGRCRSRTAEQSLPFPCSVTEKNGLGRPSRAWTMPLLDGHRNVGRHRPSAANLLSQRPLQSNTRHRGSGISPAARVQSR
jgi:hypothetical protein